VKKSNSGLIFFALGRITATALRRPEKRRAIEGRGEVSMLEQSALLLRLPQAGGPTPVPRVAILDGVTGQTLGSARWHGGRDRLAWLRWWAPPLVRVHESEDEPLLMTLRRGWGTRWLVQDADGIPVGRLRGGVLLDRKDVGIAVLQRAPNRAEAAYEDAQGQVLAATARQVDGVQLTFLHEVPASPFVRMVLLAAALVHNQDVLFP
jgi:hypothetical protein